MYSIWMFVLFPLSINLPNYMSITNSMLVDFPEFTGHLYNLISLIAVVFELVVEYDILKTNEITSIES